MLPDPLRRATLRASSTFAAEVKERCGGSRDSRIRASRRLGSAAGRSRLRRPQRMMQPGGCLKWKSKFGECLKHLRYIGDGRECLRDNAAHPDFCACACGADRLERGVAARVDRYFKVCHQRSVGACRAMRSIADGSLHLISTAFECEVRSLICCSEDCPVGVFAVRLR